MNFIFVGLGGAVGAMLRYAISLLPGNSDFPVWTFVTNCIGAVVIGFVVQLSSKKYMTEHSVLFLKTGVCGGFTTFSTFSLEAYNLFDKGMTVMGVLYAACSVIFCIFGIMLGMWLADLT